MGRMSTEVMMTELDLFWQQVFTFASWAIVLIMLVIAVRMGRKQGTPFYVLACLAACVGAFVEPLYDVAFDLWFLMSTTAYRVPCGHISLLLPFLSRIGRTAATSSFTRPPVSMQGV